MVLNLSAVALMAAAVWLRLPISAEPGAPILGLELVAVALLTVGGWMGGTLVNRNQIGVDHRYARAGTWAESKVTAAPGEAVVVAASGELEVDQMKLLHVNGQRVVLARTDDGWVAFADSCSHRGGSLADGVMICGTVQCPWHGSQFDARTGAVKAGPAGDPIATYQVKEADGRVRLVMGGEGKRS
jgi:nitrite reductase/ring-hydroxylating ferredoxin subunit